MYKLIMIDDEHCKMELDHLLEKYSDDLYFLLTDDMMSSRLDSLLVHLKSSIQAQKQLLVHTTKGVRRISSELIVYMRNDAPKNQVEILYSDGSRFITTERFQLLEEKFQHSTFFRLSDNYLLNIDFLTEYTPGDPGKIQLSNGDCFPLDASRKAAFMDFLEQYQQ